MSFLEIGSRAMEARVDNFWREPKDFDVFDEDTEFWRGKADVFWHPALADWRDESWGPGWSRMATLDELYTIKVSHSYWELPNGSWDKHIFDVLKLSEHGAKLIPEIHDLLYKVWEETHGKKKVDLNKDKTEFFDDAVKRVYDHDSIHYSVAYGDKPIYESVFKPGATVAMDMAAIWELPFEDQVRLFREEIYATALERWVIPSNYRCSPGLAYKRALRKCIVSLTKGRSARFLVENYQTFSKPDIDYVAHHKSKSHLLEKL